MSRYALIIGGVVSNVVESGAVPTVDLGGQWVACGATVALGDTFDGSNFARRAVAALRHITPLAFLSRFTDAEAVAIDLASIGATAPAAGLRRYLAKVNAAKYIDLDRADTRAGVQALEAATLLAAGRAAVILDAAVQASEIA